MTDGWVEPEYSQELLIAVGRVALSFAALDVGLAVILSGGEEKLFRDLCGEPLSKKLKKLKGSRTKKRLKLPIGRIRELAEIRNDLMHGFTWITVYPTVSEELALENPARRRTTRATLSSLTKISKEVDTIVERLAIRSLPSWKKVQL
jgi:hypothetical protein